MKPVENTRANFFPNTKINNTKQAHQARQAFLKRNDVDRKQEIETKTKGDAKVNINAATRDFARIKQAVDRAPEVDNSEKIAALKAQIQSGTYNVDYDKLADKMLSQEF